MSHVELSWSEAAVKDAALSVPIEGDVPKGWKQSFERTVALLGSGDWGTIQVKKDRVLVADVAPGSEDKLKHHLDSIVAQANATAGVDEDDGEARDETGEDERSDPDAEMTARFRRAQAQPPGAADESSKSEG
ncbi:MAG TPA: hypothetical protein VIH85_27480 [Solirubrobacteraceae bacterium]